MTQTIEGGVMASFHWERHPDGPFVTLIAVATTYLDPENYDLDSLKELTKREDDEEMRVFKRELREALQDPIWSSGNWAPTSSRPWCRVLASPFSAVGRP
jgi:hypothetical protein